MSLLARTKKRERGRNHGAKPCAVEWAGQYPGGAGVVPGVCRFHQAADADDRSAWWSRGTGPGEATISARAGGAVRTGNNGSDDRGVITRLRRTASEGAAAVERMAANRRLGDFLADG